MSWIETATHFEETTLEGVATSSFTLRSDDGTYPVIYVLCADPDLDSAMDRMHAIAESIGFDVVDHLANQVSTELLG